MPFRKYKASEVNIVSAKAFELLSKSNDLITADETAQSPIQRDDEKERKKRLRGTLIKFGSLAVFAFIVWAFATIAWFSSNKEVGSSGMSIRVLNDLVYGSSTIYNYSFNTTTQQYTPQTSNSLDLMQYDAVFNSNNSYTYAVMRIELTGENLAQSGTIRFVLQRDTTNSTANQLGSDYVSSVMNYRFVTISSFSATAADVLTTVHAAATAQGVAAQTFVSNNAKLSSLTFDVPYTAENWHNNKLYVYMYIDYDTELIEDYVENSLQNLLTTSNGGEVTVGNDISTLVISHL